MSYLLRRMGFVPLRRSKPLAIRGDGAKGQIAVLITKETPTAPMKKEAASAGFYRSPWGNHPRLQILTIEDLLRGKRIDYLPLQQVNVTFKKAPKVKPAPGEQLKLSDNSAA